MPKKRGGFKQQQVVLFDLIGGYMWCCIDRVAIEKSLEFELGTILASTSGCQATLRVSAFFLLKIWILTYCSMPFLGKCVMISRDVQGASRGRGRGIWVSLLRGCQTRTLSGSGWTAGSPQIFWKQAETSNVCVTSWMIWTVSLIEYRKASDK